MRVEISKKGYQQAVEASKNMWSSKKPGFYGRGMLNTNSDPYKTERIGRLGELALASVLKVNPDFSYRKFGDKYDFKINEYTIDIKTAATTKYKQLLVMGVNEYNRPVKLKADIYIAAHLIEEDHVKQKAAIELVGFCTKKQLLQKGLFPAKIGRHQNYQFDYADLQSLELLEDTLQCATLL